MIPTPSLIDMDEVHSFLSGLSPDDTGRQEFGQVVLRFEGFTDLCIADAAARTKLPPADPRHLATFEDVYAEVLAGWEREEGKAPVETDFSGSESNPTIWAVF